MVADSITLILATIFIVNLIAATRIDGQQLHQYSSNKETSAPSSLLLIGNQPDPLHIVSDLRNSLPDLSNYIKIIRSFYDFGDRDGLIDTTNFTHKDPSNLPAGEAAAFEVTSLDKEITTNIESVKKTGHVGDYSMMDSQLAEQDRRQQMQLHENRRTTTTFESKADGFRIKIPNGWIVDDINNTDPAMQERERLFGAGILAIFCPQAQAIPEIGGTYNCPQEIEGVVVVRFANLQSRPAFADIIRSDKNITTSDLLAFHLQFLEQKFGNKEIRILNNTDTSVNVIDSHTNQTIGIAPAKYIEIMYRDNLNRIIPRDISLLILSNDGNTAYVLLGSAESAMRIGRLPFEQRQVFDSFELLSPAPSQELFGQNSQALSLEHRF